MWQGQLQKPSAFSSQLALLVANASGATGDHLCTKALTPDWHPDTAPTERACMQWRAPQQRVLVFLLSQTSTRASLTGSRSSQIWKKKKKVRPSLGLIREARDLGKWLPHHAKAAHPPWMRDARYLVPAEVWAAVNNLHLSERPDRL